MSFKFTAVAFGFGIGAACLAGASFMDGQDPPSMPDDAMAIVEQLKTAHDNPMMPSAFHAKLQHFVGDWDVTVRVWMMGPEGPPSESQGEASVDWILDGRFTQEQFTGEFDMGGMTVEMSSLTITGYDNYRNQYVGNMYGSWSTEIIPMQGGASPDGKMFDFYGTMHEPMLNVAGRMVRFVTTIVDDDHHTLEVYDLHAGPDYKVMEFSYARK